MDAGIVMLLQHSLLASEAQNVSGANSTYVEIFRAAIQSTLGIFGLMILVLGLLAYKFFQSAPTSAQVVVFLIAFGGVSAFGFAVARAQKAASAGDEYAVLPLHLQFPLNYVSAYPPTAILEAFVDNNPVFTDDPKQHPVPPHAKRDGAGIIALFRSVHTGQMLRVEVHDAGRTWSSEDYTVPTFTLNMRRPSSANAAVVK